MAEDIYSSYHYNTFDGKLKWQDKYHWSIYSSISRQHLILTCFFLIFFIQERKVNCYFSCMNIVNQIPQKNYIMSRNAHVVCLVIPVRLSYWYWFIVFPQFDMPHHLDIYTIQFFMYGLNAVGNWDSVCTHFCYYALNLLVRGLYLDTSV